MPTPPPPLLPSHSYNNSPSKPLSRSDSTSSGLDSPSATRRAGIFDMSTEKAAYEQGADKEKGDLSVSSDSLHEKAMMRTEGKDAFCLEARLPASL